MRSEYTPVRIMKALEEFRWLRVPLATPERLDTKHHEPAFAGSFLESQLETLADLERAICELSRLDFLIVAAAFILGVPFDEISATLGMPQNYVSMRSYAAARNMAVTLGWRGFGGEATR